MKCVRASMTQKALCFFKHSHDVWKYLSVSLGQERFYFHKSPQVFCICPCRVHDICQKGKSVQNEHESVCQSKKCNIFLSQDYHFWTFSVRKKKANVQKCRQVSGRCNFICNGELLTRNSKPGWLGGTVNPPHKGFNVAVEKSPFSEAAVTVQVAGTEATNISRFWRLGLRSGWHDQVLGKVLVLVHTQPPSAFSQGGKRKL